MGGETKTHRYRSVERTSGEQTPVVGSVIHQPSLLGPSASALLSGVYQIGEV
jgi:hypothetical protein